MSKENNGLDTKQIEVFTQQINQALRATPEQIIGFDTRDLERYAILWINLSFCLINHALGEKEALVAQRLFL